MTPESPRKTPKKHEFSSPRKSDHASPGPERLRNGQSPIGRPKPKFNLDESVATGDSGVKMEGKDYLDIMPGSPPVFEGLVKLKEKKVEPKIEPKTEPKSGPEVTPKNVKTVKKIEGTPIDSPHKIYLRTEKKKKEKPKVDKNGKKVKKEKTKKCYIAEDDDVKYNAGNRITDFFEIRRSSRKPAKQIEQEKTILWRKLVRDDCTDGLEVRDVPLKGRGVFNTRYFQKDEFVVEYSGDLIDLKRADIRDQKYSENTDKYGSYMYYFVHKGTKWCIDATIESEKIGRLLNHSCKTPNCATKIIEVDHIPRLVIYAKEDIPTNNELLYDYGDRGKLSLEAHPWLKL